MKFSYEILKKHDVILETVSGEVTVEELVRKVDRVLSDPAYRPQLSGVLDMRKATSRMTKVELYGFVEYVNRSGTFSESKWAIIAADPIIVALSHIFQQRVPHQELISIVNSPEAAADFLGKPEIIKHLEPNGDDSATERS